MRAAIFRRSWVAGGAETYLMDLGRCLGTQGFAVEYLSVEPEVPAENLRLLGKPETVESFYLLNDDAVAVQDASRQYDLFVNGASHFPIAAQATQNWLVVFAPGAAGSTVIRKGRRACTSIARRAVDALPGLPGTARLRNHLRRYPPATERSAERTYDAVVGISNFVAGRLAARYYRRCEVVYPSVSPMACNQAKEPLAVSVGRFSPWGNVKRHDAMIEAARYLAAVRPDIQVVFVGSLPRDDASHRYIANLRARSKDLSSVKFVVNAQRCQVEEWLGRASVYWHAAGYGLDAVKAPDAVEQFGISIVEGMSAAAVPIVYPVAGPAEIVTDGVDGRYWTSTSGLAELTAAMLSDHEERSRLATAATRRSRDFLPERMGESVRALLRLSPPGS